MRTEKVLTVLGVICTAIVAVAMIFWIAESSRESVAHLCNTQKSFTVNSVEYTCSRLP